MKYNPRFTEKISSFDRFTSLHPLLPQLPHGDMMSQGSLELMKNLENLLAEITGMDAFTLQPLAGAHGELTGVMLIAAYHKKLGNKKKYILIPDSGHGTNPASAAIAGFTVKTVPSDEYGCVDFEAFKKEMNRDVAAVMLTCPNTLGVFNPRIHEIADLTHEAGGLMYYDGANLNAIMGKTRPGDLGFDVVHVNLHKTFSTPHGGGGPGAGPVGVKDFLMPFMPTSRIVQREDGTFSLDYNQPDSIGYIAPFYGNFLVLVKAYAYILHLGAEGLERVSENSVLNANYLLSRLAKTFKPGTKYKNGCMHEFVLSALNQKQKNVSALDIAKALIDKGVHPPTVYFPLIVKEALMIEPTETESKETLDLFIGMLEEMASEIERNPEPFHQYPQTTPVSRLDEVQAARNMHLCCLDDDD
jgi:glycine dehydrogenase subunit 2